MEVSAELLPDHPIAVITADTTHPEWGVHKGEPIGFLCVECKNMDEDVAEIIHEEDCSLAGKSKPTAYANRP